MEKQQTFFDFAAEAGLTKHHGSHEATAELVRLCHIDAGAYVLDVGCGGMIHSALRGLRMYIRNPRYRRFVKDVSKSGHARRRRRDRGAVHRGLQQAGQGHGRSAGGYAAVSKRAKGLRLRLFCLTLRWAQTFAVVREDSMFDIGLVWAALRCGACWANWAIACGAAIVLLVRSRQR